MVEKKERMSAIHALVRRNLQTSAEMQQSGQVQGGFKDEGVSGWSASLVVLNPDRQPET